MEVICYESQVDIDIDSDTTVKDVTKEVNGGENATESYTGDIQMLSGINSYTEPWGDPDGDGNDEGSGSTGCGEYTTVCNTVNVWSSVCSCRGHFPEEYCTCTGPRIDFVQTSEECKDVCVSENYNDSTGGTNNNNSNGGGNGNVSSSTGDDTPTDVATTPVNPDGSNAFTAFNLDALTELQKTSFNNAKGILMNNCIGGFIRSN